MSVQDEVAQLRAEVEAYRKAAKEAKDTTEGFNSSVKSIFELGSSVGGSKVGGMTPAFEEAAEAISGMTDAGSKSLSFLGTLASKIPGVGSAANAMFQAMSVGTSILGELGEGAVESAKLLAETFDGPSRALREYDKGIFDLGKQFGSTIGEAERFADGLRTETASQFAQSMYLTKDAMTGFVEATKNTSLSLDQLNQSVDTGIGSTKLYAVAAAQAAAMGVSVSEGAEYFNTAMNKQGKSAQEAAEMIGGFSAVAKETGLRASTVASTLNSAVQGFEKLGMSADFGRPILEGFGRTMQDMGLGIENAVDLTRTLTSALADLTTNYANAYLVFQRGGLDIGGGGGSGVLGASIGMQAAMLEAEQTGEQSDIGAQLAMGMKDTLASFTGGDIVTVQQAAESPELQNQFYIQQQMLKNQFGVGDDKSATRVLDMLSRLDDATRSGDVDTKAELEKQLKNEMEGRDKTLDEWEKANQQLAIQSNLLAVLARPALEGMRGVAAAGRRKLTGGIQAGGEAIRGRIGAAGSGGLQDSLLSALDSLGLEGDSSISQILSAPGGGANAPRATRGDVGTLTRAATMEGPADNAGIVEAATNLSGNLDNFNLNMNELPANIERASMLAASEASTSALEQAGFSSRRDLADAMAVAIADAFAAKLSIEIDLTDRAGSVLNAAATISNELGQGTRNRAGASTD